VTEDEGKSLLRARFVEAGYAIAIDVPFREDGVDVNLDGWDAHARVGFEYITDEAGDAREFTPEAIARLEARTMRGELAILLIDERDAVDAASLDEAARGFLAHLESARSAR
jgi:hypothetical protein